MKESKHPPGGAVKTLTTELLLFGRRPLQHRANSDQKRVVVQRTDDTESEPEKSLELISRCSSFILHVFDEPASLFSSFNSCCNKRHLVIH